MRTDVRAAYVYRFILHMRFCESVPDIRPRKSFANGSEPFAIRVDIETASQSRVDIASLLLASK